MLAQLPINTAAREVFEPLVDFPLSEFSAGTVLEHLMIASHHGLLNERERYYPHSRYPQDITEVFANPSYRDELLLNGAATAAGLLNPYTTNFSQKLGYPENYFGSAWNKRNGFMRKFEGAGILKAANPTNTVEYDGLDRLVHMTHHMSLMIILGLSKRHTLPYYLQSPPIFGSLHDFGQMVSPRDTLKQTSFLARVTYEGIQTINLGNLRKVLH